MQIRPGKVQELPVLEIIDTGYILGTSHSQVLLPKRQFRGKPEEGQLLEVFVFYNENRELEASSRLPEIQLDEVGAFRVKNVNEIGAFIDIGSVRDILIPNKEQRVPLEEGNLAVVILKDGSENKRLFASTKLTRYLKNTDLNYERGEAVEIIIAEKMDLGRRVIINGKHLGFLFQQEIMRPVNTGDKLVGYVRQIENNSITVSTQKEGTELLQDARARLLEFIQSNGGYIRLNDDTSPDEIKLRLRMSKKSFKKAAGILFKEGLVELTKLGIKLVKTETKIDEK
jgi:predicted RNA-binding protein (virulence factor B family)